MTSNLLHNLDHLLLVSGNGDTAIWVPTDRHFESRVHIGHMVQVSNYTPRETIMRHGSSRFVRNSVTYASTLPPESSVDRHGISRFHSITQICAAKESLRILSILACCRQQGSILGLVVSNELLLTRLHPGCRRTPRSTPRLGKLAQKVSRSRSPGLFDTASLRTISEPESRPSVQQFAIPTWSS